SGGGVVRSAGSADATGSANVSSSATTTRSTIVAGCPSPPCPPGAVCPAVACPAPEPVPAPERPAGLPTREQAEATARAFLPQVRTITGVRVGLAFAPLLGPDNQERALLVPVLLFDLEDGGTVPVLAVADEFLPKPVPAGKRLPDPGPAATEPAPGPAPRPAE